MNININGGISGAPGSYLRMANFGNSCNGSQPSVFAVPGLEEYYGKDIFLTEALTLEAIKALDKVKQEDKPFFLYMSHYAIRGPLQKEMRCYEKYKKKGLADLDTTYAALIEGMDKSLGDLMDYLESNKLMDNTIILFMSDNGGMATGFYGRTPLYMQNAPLSSSKGAAHEGGIREPMMVYWPEVTTPGSECDKYLIIEDFSPTILEMVQTKHYRTVQHIDGVSFVPLLKVTGDLSKNRALYWNFPNGWGKWKLIYYYGSGKKELFNIVEDISEKNNLVAEYPDIVSKLSKDLSVYLRQKDAQRPFFKSTVEAVPWPNEVKKFDYLIFYSLN